ncbi:MAG TPA: hypothetical protein DCG53_14645 [Syntrophus sp. (in: bacteria)]|nr:hypothetical protein [Syntrophus sp. (in: bacteria)]
MMFPSPDISEAIFISSRRTIWTMPARFFAILWACSCAAASRALELLMTAKMPTTSRGTITATIPPTTSLKPKVFFFIVLFSILLWKHL